MRDGRQIKRLVPGAIPSLNLNLPEKHPQRNPNLIHKPRIRITNLDKIVEIVSSPVVEQPIQSLSHKKCCIKNCRNKTSSSVSLFQFPGPGKARIAEKWTAALDRVVCNAKNLYVCSDHFKDEDFCEYF